MGNGKICYRTVTIELGRLGRNILLAKTESSPKNDEFISMYIGVWSVYYMQSRWLKAITQVVLCLMVLWQLQAHAIYYFNLFSTIF